MTEALLRNLLREWITEEYVVTRIGEFEDEFDAAGQRIPHPEAYRARQLSRLAKLQQICPDRTDIHELHRATLRALSHLRPEERLYGWSALSSIRDYSGVACASGIITFYPTNPSPDDDRPTA